MISFAKQLYQLSVIYIMKKGISISLALLMLTAMLHLTVATHYCSGKIVASEVSLTGKLANCGMEGTENDLSLPGTNFTKHCCDDIVTLFGIDSNYIPSFPFVPESFQYSFHVFANPVDLSGKSQTDFYSIYSNISPPGAWMSTNVDLSCICSFRI